MSAPVETPTLGRTRPRSRPALLNTLEQDVFAISAYRRLRTTVLNQMTEHAINSVMVTGPTANVGKTTTSISLAVNMARHSDIKVVLVELDLRSPSLATELGLRVRHGIEKVVEADFCFQDALLPLHDTGVLVVPCGQRCDNSTEVLLSTNMIDLFRHLDSLGGRFRVVFDTPPIMGCDDVQAILPHMRSALLVAGEGQTTRVELRDGIDALSSLPLLGVTLNRSTSSQFEKYYY